MGFRKAAPIVRKPAAVVVPAALRGRAHDSQVQPQPPRYSNRAGAHLVQAKLTIIKSSDPAERDADRAADQFLKHRDSHIRVSSAQQQPLHDGIPVDATLARRIQWLRGQGAPLPSPLRRQFEARMQRGLSTVRVHTSSEAAELAAMLDARAFTAGTDIFFGSGEWQPGSDSGRRLIAHEVAHTVQQSQSTSAPVVHREEKGLLERAKERTAEVIGEGAALVGSAALAVVRKVSPELAKVIDIGPFEYIKQKLSSALEEWMPNLFKDLSIAGAIAKVRAGFSSMLEKIKKGPSEEACKNFAETLGKIRDFIADIIDNPVAEFFRTNLEKFQATMVKVSAFVLAPVFDFFRDQVASTWAAIKKVAGWIWDGIKKVKDFYADALEWTLRKLGVDVGGDNEEGVWGWVKRKAGEAWAVIRKALDPVIEPIKTSIKVGLALTPLGPIYLLIRYGPEVVKSIGWLWEHRNDPNIIENSHKEMGNTILPKILDAVTNADGKFRDGVKWLTGKIEELSAVVLTFVGKMTGLPLLGIVRGVVAEMSDALKDFVAWGRATLQKGAEFFQKLVEDVSKILKPYKEILSSLALAIVNPAMIPLIIAGWAWRGIPKCFKVPIIDFILDIVIKALSKAPELLFMGPLWPLLKSAVLATLEAFRKRPPADKEALSDKIANIISGANPEFLIAFVKGFLTGVWESVTDPIKAIWAIVEGLNKLLELFDKWTGNEQTQTVAVATREKPMTMAAAAGAPGPGAPAPAAPESATAAPEASPAPAAEGGEDAVQIPPEEKTDVSTRLGQMGKELQPPTGVVVGQFTTAAEQYFNASGGTSFPQLVAKLGEAYDGIRAKISEESGKLANKLVEYLLSKKADSEIGDKLGWLTGLIVTQLILDYLTAGINELARPVQIIVKFLNWPMEVLGAAFKVVGKIGKALVGWIKKLGGMVKDAAAGAFFAVKEALGTIGSKLVQFAEEIIARFSKFGKKAGGAVAKEGEALGERGIAKAAQEGKALGAAERKAVDAEGLGTKAGKTAEQDAKKAAEGEKKAAEKETTNAKKEAERKAKESAEAPAAILEGRAIVRAANLGHLPLPLVFAKLAVLKLAHSWIKYFEPIEKGKRIGIHMRASDYDLGDIDVSSPYFQGEKGVRVVDEPPPGMTHGGPREAQARVNAQEAKLKGEIAEARHQAEITGSGKVKVPQPKEIMSNQRYEELLTDLHQKKSISMSEFADNFPPQGATQVKMRFDSPEGIRTRFVDHMFKEGNQVVLRESKDVAKLSVGPRLRQQLDGDLWLARTYPGTILEWRIDGALTAEAKETFKLLIKENPGLLRVHPPGILL